MKIARVIGSTISTIEDPKVKETKLLLCRQTTPSGEESGAAYVAIDLVDAGTGDLVLTCHGSAARQTFLTKDAPVDAVIMAVIDHLEVDGDVVFRQ
ncbi:MAG: EutN/CcmL family microcompartment protein [Chloroflexota bacterium]